MKAQSLGSLRSWFTALSPGQRVLVLSVGTLDAGLRVWALVDLARRPAAQVRGPKAAWAAGLAVVSSAGILPAVYLRYGRQGT